MTPELKKLIEWIAENTWVEPLSGFMPGGPYWNVSAMPLLDAIAESHGIDKEEIGDVFNPAREKYEDSLQEAEDSEEYGDG